MKRGAAYRAVTESDSTSKLDKVTSTDGVVLLHERNQVVDRVVDAVVSGKVGLDGGEEEHGAVSSATSLGALALGDSNGIV